MVPTSDMDGKAETIPPGIEEIFKLLTAGLLTVIVLFLLFVALNRLIPEGRGPGPFGTLLYPQRYKTMDRCTFIARL